MSGPHDMLDAPLWERAGHEEGHETPDMKRIIRTDRHGQRKAFLFDEGVRDLGNEYRFMLKLNRYKPKDWEWKLCQRIADGEAIVLEDFTYQLEEL